MTKFRISGIWKNKDNVITHYAFHPVGEASTSRADKVTKAEAIKLLEIGVNSATTWIWNYKQSNWNVGENVEVVNGTYGKYLRSNPNDKTTDNLGHLIDFDWIFNIEQ
jgi:hypothetical protein